VWKDLVASDEIVLGGALFFCLVFCLEARCERAGLDTRAACGMCFGSRRGVRCLSLLAGLVAVVHWGVHWMSKKYEVGRGFAPPPVNLLASVLSGVRVQIYWRFSFGCERVVCVSYELCLEVRGASSVSLVSNKSELNNIYFTSRNTERQHERI